VLTFFIAGLLYLLRFERVDNLGAYRIPSGTGILIRSVYITYIHLARFGYRILALNKAFLSPPKCLYGDICHEEALMSRNKTLGMMSTALLIIVIVALVVTPGAWAKNKFKTLHRFPNGGKDGKAPTAGLVFDTAGNLYGTTAYGGGKRDAGTVFRLTPDPDGSWRETLPLATFAA
jgi:uncharacterized repeat protein (TIGR03803 family)